MNGISLGRLVARPLDRVRIFAGACFLSRNVLRPGIAAVAFAVALQIPSSARADAVARDGYGVNCGPWRTTGHVAETDQIIASGVKWVRMIPNWSSIETSQGVYNTSYLAALDQSINRFVSRDVNVVLSIGMTPQWASTLPTAPWPDFAKVRPSNWAYWENFISFLANRYNNKVFHWEIWNEPDYNAFWTGSVAEYAELLKRASPIIKGVNSNNKVLLGGLAMQSTPTTESYGLGTFFDQVMAVSGVSAAFDIVNYHAYGKMNRHILMHKGMQDVIAKYSIQSKPLWITETGYSQSSSSSDLETLKADYVDQAWFLYETWGEVDRVFYHHYRNITSSSFSEANFAFTTTSLAPLKALYHYGAIGGALADPQLQAVYPTQTASTLPFFYNSYGSLTKPGHLVPAGLYAYYRVDDSWAYDVNQTYYAEVTYLDQGTGNFAVQFDAAGGAYTSVNVARPGTNTGNWVTSTATLSNAKFANSQNNFADVRLSSGGAELFVRSLVIRRASDNATMTVSPLALASGDGSSVMAQSRIGANGYMYFKIHDTWMANNQNSGDTTAYIDIIYKDVGSGNFAVHYDATTNAHASVLVGRTNTGTWKTASLALPNAKFANSEDNGCDLRIHAGGSELAVKSVVLSRDLNPGSVRFKATSEFKMMRPRTDTNSANMGYTVPTTMGGIECHQITANGKYLHAEVSSALVRPDQTNVTITVTFWDQGTDGIVLEWASNAASGVSGQTIFKTNTNAWRTVSVPVTNAKFDHDLSYNADVRVNNRGDASVEYVSRIDVTPN